MQSAHDESFPVRVEKLFHDAWDLAPVARADYLLAECRDDEALRHAVEDLLESAAEAQHLVIWKSPAILDEARRTKPDPHSENTTLGRYTLLEQIGAGGMGVVHKAVRADDTFWKLVAVKIVPWGMCDEATLRHFRQERQILAGLEHSNIARLLDGGTTPDGRPFLVMEYVDGIPVTRYLADNEVSLRQSLELFRTICGAVSYAHRNLVVHRDLKPGNILVTRDGTPMLLDFGIARLQNQSPLSTRTSAAAMTPEYASPEQLSDATITTASDIYSLGVILCEMLTGSRPYRRTTGALDLAHAICSEPPQIVWPPERRRLPDLENIVHFALRKDAGRRYASADQFSEDIRLYLGGFPVHARPDTPAYRASKFLRRNRAGVGAALLTTVLLTALTAGMFFQWREARQRFDDVRSLSSSLIFGVYDSVRDLPGALAARRRVAETARVYLDRLAAARAPDDGLRLELATAYRKLGDIQGQPYTSSLGDTAGALESYGKARQLLENTRVRNQQALALVYQMEGNILTRQGHPAEARKRQLQAVALFETLQRAHSDDRDATWQVSAAWLYLGQSEFSEALQHPGVAGFEAARRDYLHSSDIVAGLLQRAPADPKLLHSFGTLQCYVAYALWQLGEVTPDPKYYLLSTEYTRRGIESAERALQADAGRFSLRWALSDAYGDHGRALQFTGDEAGAGKYQQKSLDGLKRLAVQEPDNQELSRSMADSHFHLGRSQARTRPSEAMGHYRMALSYYLLRLQGDPQNMENVRSTINVRDAIAAILERKPDRVGVADMYRQNLALIQRVKYPGETEAREQSLLRSVSQ